MTTDGTTLTIKLGSAFRTGICSTGAICMNCASPVCSIAARVLFSTTGTQRSALNLGSPGTR